MFRKELNSWAWQVMPDDKKYHKKNNNSKKQDFSEE